MPRLALYNDGTNSALRVTKDSADVPRLVASDDYGKLAFDSLNPNQVVDTDISVDAWADFKPVPSNDRWNAYPYGSSWAQATHAVERVGTGSQAFGVIAWELLDNTVGGSFVPLITVQRHDTDGWTHINSFEDTSRTNSNSGFRLGLELNIASDVSIRPQSVHDIDGYGGYVAVTRRLLNEDAGRVEDYSGYWRARVYWGLPADASPAQFPVGPNTPGSVIARITNQQVRIARNGNDVDTATPEQLLMRDDASPIKIVAAGEVDVPEQSTVDITLPPGVDYPEEMFADAILRVVGQSEFDHPAWNSTFISFLYAAVGMRARRIGANRIRLRNTRPVDITARYLVTGFDPRPPSTGTAKVLAGYQDAGGGYIQIRRPGTGDPPRLGDVLLDSRWPYVPIVTEGRWSFPTSGNAGSPETRSHTVDFVNNGGWRPYPLFMTEFSDGTFLGARTEILIGTQNFGSSSSWNRQHSANSVYARITDTSVRFFAHPRHPTRISQRNTAFGWQYDPSYDGPRPVAIRYYILAVPVST